MIKFNISDTDDDHLHRIVCEKIDNLTKPRGSLGRLETLAAQICMIQRSTSPVLKNPFNILFAADHGILDEGVSVSPKEVTWQQSYHFMKGGAGISYLCRQHGFRLIVVDAGIDHDMDYGSGIINMKIRRGTDNFIDRAAMTDSEMELCLERGAACTDMAAAEGCNIISFGEMGSGNTTASAAWMASFTDIPPERCVGAGAGLDSNGISHKLNVLRRALDNYPGDHSVTEIMARFGGFEMVMATGAMLRAAELRMTILVDGFIMTNCILAASKLYPQVLKYAIFGHCGDESGHRLLLDWLGASPLLSLGMRLGEGSGAVCAFPVVDSAVRMINEMDSFGGASVTKYF